MVTRPPTKARIGVDQAPAKLSPNTIPIAAHMLAPEETLPRIVDAKVKDARVTLVPAHGVR